MTPSAQFIFCLSVGFAFAACDARTARPVSSPGQDETAALGRKVEHLEGLLAGRPLASRALDALTAALPDGVRLTEVSYDSGKMRIKGTAPSNNLLADYIARLGQSPALTDLTLGASAMKIVQGRESWEFSLEAFGGEIMPFRSPSISRLHELEQALPSRQDSSEMLRALQRQALDAGLQMVKFVPGNEVAGEFTSALPVAVEVSGSLNELESYLRGLAEPPSLWIVEQFSLRAVSPDDPRSPVRASVAARAYFAR